MRITKPYRGHKAVKRLDLTDMREVFKDRRVWSSVGVVTIPDGESTWWSIEPHDDGSSVDVLVDVVLHPSETPVTCRLPAGIWDVPDEGDEVGVILPEGAIDFMPLIVCRLSTNSVPSTQGPQPGRIVIERDEVIVHDGDGGAERAILGETYRSAEDTLMTALSTFSAAVSTFAATCVGPTAPQLLALQTAAVAIQTAVTSFKTGGSTYLCTVLKAK